MPRPRPAGPPRSWPGSRRRRRRPASGPPGPPRRRRSARTRTPAAPRGAIPWPGAMAAAKSAKVRTTSTIARVFSSCSRSCANPSWSDSTMVSLAAESGSAAAARPPMPTRSWVAFSSDFMSRTRTPFWVETTSPPPSSTWMKRLWARRLSCSHSDCGRGRWSSLSTACSAGCLSAPAAGPASGSARGGSASSMRRLHVHVRVQLVDQEARELAPDLVVLEQLGAGVRPVVGVQQLAVRPDREQPDEREQRRDAISTRGRRRRRTTATQPPWRRLRQWRAHVWDARACPTVRVRDRERDSHSESRCGWLRCPPSRLGGRPAGSAGSSWARTGASRP